MPITTARRIVAIGARNYATSAHITTTEAEKAYAEAISVCNEKDARDTIAKLNELADKFNLTATELIARFA